MPTTGTAIDGILRWFGTIGAFEVATNVTVTDVLLAALFVVLGWYVSQLVVSLVGRQVARRFRRPSITKTVLRGIRGIILFIAVATAAAQVGLGASNLLLSVTVFSATVGLILAPIIGSVINGLFLLADQPYEIGDLIELVDTSTPEGGTRGYVEDITLRYTKIFTMQNTFLVIPNATMRERDVVNYSAEDTRSRLSLQLQVTYEGDLDEARAIMERAARNTPEVVASGPDIRIGSARYPSDPVAQIRDYADHGVLLELRYWVKDPYYMRRVHSHIMERIWEEIQDADVEIAYPHSHLVFDDTSGVARVAVEREPQQRTPPSRPVEFDER
ncbi:mechanosensitive ion channel family protein (plasmid) [Haladaptatus sp. SPP-AMP-3]|uniref:mechanosensitive ion channel family protein n=1 Tax=Haladaptatus sp. SPP-AMP-3 TaxID=3121295 RepID=UPI003C2CFA35